MLQVIYIYLHVFHLLTRFITISFRGFQFPGLLRASKRLGGRRIQLQWPVFNLAITTPLLLDACYDTGAPAYRTLFLPSKGGHLLRSSIRIVSLKTKKMIQEENERATR